MSEKLGSHRKRKVFALHLSQGISKTIVRRMEDGQKTVSRIISGHCGVRAHLKRFSIVDESMCV
jgi:hypothetical protein